MAIKPVLIMAGGTGGHVYPALAIADYLKACGIDLCWLGTPNGLESRVVPQNNIELLTIKISGLRGKHVFRWVLAPFTIMAAIVSSLKIMINLKPSLVIGLGGFVSGPGGIAAWILRIPLLIHEQNSIAGLTNRLLTPFANTVMQAFPGALSGKQVVTTGNPVRVDIIEKAKEKDNSRATGNHESLRVLVLGGSLGARALNEAVPQALNGLPDSARVEVLHQTGTAHIESTSDIYSSTNSTSYKVVPYIEDMAKAYAWADLAICRAGALTVSEISVMGLPAIFIPYPYAVDDHQTMNARYLTDAGGGVLLPQTELNKHRLIELITYFYEKPDALSAMSEIAKQKARSDATETIGNICLGVLNA